MMYHLMHDVLALTQETMQRYDGTPLYVSSEGFLALFGAPVAQEDHARRAVLAACELRQRVHAPAALRGQAPGVVLRLGLHNGPVVVGPRADAPQQPYAVGTTLHGATWLQQRTAPDTILVSATTYTLVQDEVEGEACESCMLTEPSPLVPVYAIHGLRRRVGRGAVPGPSVALWAAPGIGAAPTRGWRRRSVGKDRCSVTTCVRPRPWPRRWAINAGWRGFSPI
jgi:class 3 adenylate cyclase